ncbi:FitA-like ribbon-helix-helix domain-containing protein [Azospirillum sp. sgz302134]
MGRMIIDGIDSELVEALRQRAAEHGRSLDAEVRLILAQAVTPVDAAMDDEQHRTDLMRARADAMRARLSGRPHSDSVALLREDRDR